MPGNRRHRRFSTIGKPAQAKLAAASPRRSATWSCLRLLEPARVLVRLNHIASFIVNANHSIMRSAEKLGNALLVATSGARAACVGFGFARTTAATFDVFYC